MVALTATASTTRVIFRCTYKPCDHAQSFKCGCEPCGYVFAHEYEERNGRLVRFVVDTWTGKMVAVTLEEDADRCPKCHKRFVKYGNVIGHVGHKHCNDECLIATSETCNCSCGGKNHGKAHLS